MSKKKDSLKPWLSRPAINRSVTLPLTRPLTQRLSNLNEFHPNELDPYLLFDARDSMIGTLENPTLDLDPSKPDTLNVITATRAGIATYTDPDGNIATASADTVRVDHVDGVPMILVEPSSRNVLLYSEDFSDSYWTKNGTASVTPNTTISPDGTQNADTISNATGTSTGDTVYRSINPDDVDHTFSAYVKSAGATTMSLIMRNGITGVILSQAISLTDEWQRVTLTHNLQNGQVIFGNSDGNFHLWGAQLETGSVATSLIPTAGGDAAARTRAADALEITGSAFTDAYNQSEGTIYTEFVPRRVDYYQHLYEFSDGSANNRINVHLESANARFYLTSGGTVYANTIAATNVTTGELHRTGFSYKTNDAPASFDGSTEITDTTVTVPSGIDKVFLGALYTQANDFYLNGHIKRLIYWPYHSDSL